MHPSQFAPALVSHLVSRIVLCGGGGMDARTSGVVFMISPRVAFIECVVSNGNTDQRPILHLRDESHADGHGTRLHLNCGDRNMSHLSLGLRAGSTALVALLGGRHLRPPAAARLTAALRAMRAFSRDPNLTVTARCGDGRGRTAPQISRRTAQWVEQHVNELPEWAGAVLQQWHTVLDLLEQGGAVATSAMLDWSILHGLFGQVLREHGFAEPEELRPFNRRFSIAERELGSDPEWGRRDRVIGAPDLESSQVRRALHQAGLPLPDALRVIRLRVELAELFTRYADLDDGGLFRTLDRAGVLRHQFPGVDETVIRHAEQHAPQDTRAGLRGALVHEHGAPGKRDGFLVNWGRISDHHQHRELDLCDPFKTAGEWRSLPAPGAGRPAAGRGAPVASVIHEELLEVADFYDLGCFDQAIEILEDIRPLLAAADRGVAAAFAAWEARVRARLGQPEAAARAAALALEGAACRLREATEYACIFRFAGLTPPPAIDPWLKRGSDCLAREPALRTSAQGFLDHLGYTALRRGQFADALTTLGGAAAAAGGSGAARVSARAHADLADALRLAGRCGEAAAHLELAQQIQLPHHFFGEFAEFTLTIRGKLAATEGNRTEALRLFEEAAAGLPPARSPVAFVRAQLLIARLRGAGLTAKSIKSTVAEIRTDCPALAGCLRLAQVLAHWEDWLAGAPPPFVHPDAQFWGL